jgi:hypothetical protein
VDSVFFALDSNQRNLASRVTMNVGQTFLHQAEYDEFHFGWEASQVLGNLQINFKTAALRKTLYVFRVSGARRKKLGRTPNRSATRFSRSDAGFPTDFTTF